MENYDYSLYFIKSKVWEIITQNKDNDILMPFAIPEPCRVNHSLSCLLDKSHDQENKGRIYSIAQ